MGLKPKFNTTLSTKRTDVLVNEINNAKTIPGQTRLSMGEITRRMLAKKGIESPNTATKVQISRNTWIQPKVEFKNEAEREAWIEEMKIKYKI